MTLLGTGECKYMYIDEQWLCAMRCVPNGIFTFDFSLRGLLGIDDKGILGNMCFWLDPIVAFVGVLNLLAVVPLKTPSPPLLLWDLRFTCSSSRSGEISVELWVGE